MNQDEITEIRNIAERSVADFYVYRIDAPRIVLDERAKDDLMI